MTSACKGSRWFVMMFVGLCFCEYAWATFSLDMTPARGGQGIRFTQEGVAASSEELMGSSGLFRNEEVTLTIDTDQAAPYRILQTVFQPLTNEIGQTIPADAFIMYSPSNPAGSLRTTLETPVHMGQFPIYTSNNAGAEDTFVLVYNVRLPENQPGGIYRTQITYTAEPANAQEGMNPSIRTLDVRVEVAAQFRLDIQNSKGARSIDLGRITKERSSGSDVLNFNIQSSAGARFRLTAQMSEPLISPSGNALQGDALTVLASAGSSVGSLQIPPTAVPLATGSEMIYSSDNGGSDQFQLQFVANPAPTQRAGIYQSTWTLRIESQSPAVKNEVINIPIRFEIEPIFSLETKIEQSNGLNFGSFKTGEENEIRQVAIDVRSNLGQPYQVSQVIPRKMMNEKGASLNDDYFKVKVEGPQSGTVLISDFEPVRMGEAPLFTSDAQGSPETLVLSYNLTIPKNSQAGNYTTELKYSITTL